MGRVGELGRVGCWERGWEAGRVGEPGREVKQARQGGRAGQGGESGRLESRAGWGAGQWPFGSG